MGAEAALERLWESSSSSNLEHNQLSFEARCLNKSGGGFRFCIDRNQALPLVLDRGKTGTIKTCQSHFQPFPAEFATTSEAKRI